MNPLSSSTSGGRARSSRAAFTFLAGVGAAAALSAAEPSLPEARDKSHYHLFDPTPPELMRELSADRPDKTESPYTVDAGHFQLEMDFFNYTYDRYNPARSDARMETWSAAAVNLKFGLCNNVDFQLVLETYQWQRIHDRAAGTVEERSGFGDVIPRLKINFWGNDSGTTAFGVMPFVKLPTNQDHVGNNAVEGGLIFPLAAQLPGGWSMGLMTEFDFIRDETGDGHHPEFVNTVTFGHSIAGALSGYGEFFSVVSTESGSPWGGGIGGGLTYALTRNLQLDAGMNVGLTRAADDWNPFMGVTWRF